MKLKEILIETTDEETTDEETTDEETTDEEKRIRNDDAERG